MLLRLVAATATAWWLRRWVPCALWLAVVGGVAVVGCLCVGECAKWGHLPFQADVGLRVFTNLVLIAIPVQEPVSIFLVIRPIAAPAALPLPERCKCDHVPSRDRPRARAL